MPLSLVAGELSFSFMIPHFLDFSYCLKVCTFAFAFEVADPSLIELQFFGS